MDQALEAQVQQRLSELPEEIRLAVQSADLDRKIQAIGQKHKLHIDQIGNLEDETLLVMLGFADPTEFMDQLVERASVTPVQASLISADVAHDIFMPIRESMRLWAERRKSMKDTDSAPAPTAPASSVVMPSSKPVETPPAPVAIRTPAPAAPIVPPVAQTPAAAPKPAPDLHAADAMLSQKQVSTPASATAAPLAAPAAAPAPQKPAPSPAQPQNYKADPYREPVE